MTISPQNCSMPMVFVLCTPRSGSSLLRYIVDTHPAICCPGELSLGQLCESLYHTFYYTHGQVRATDDETRRQLCLTEVRQVVNGIMASYAALKGKTIWCEKTPKNVEQRELIYNVFPKARFICLYRHCMDMVYSSIEGGKYGKMDELWSPTQVFEAWIDQTEKILSFERQHESQVIRMTYESLVLHPSEELKRLFGFLGLHWPDHLSDKIFSVRHDEGLGDVKVSFAKSIHSNSIGRGLQLKNISPSKSALQRINLLLGALGYPEVGPQWDEFASKHLRNVSVCEPKKQIGSVRDVFLKYIPSKTQNGNDTLRGLSGIVKILVKGDSDGVWRVDLSRQPSEITASDGKADCTLTVAARDLLQMANGSLNPGECFLQARLKVEGNADLAYRFGQVIFGA